MKTAPFQIHTDLDYPHLLELHRVVDGILAPKCLRKKQRFNVAISVIDIAVGIFCVQMTGKLWVAVMFGAGLLGRRDFLFPDCGPDCTKADGQAGLFHKLHFRG